VIANKQSTMAVDILLFGDQSDVDVFPFIRKFLLRREQTGLVEIFLENASSALRTSIAGLSAPYRKQIPSFVNLLDFIDSYRLSSCRNAIVDSTLLCIAQLAHYIRQGSSN
jgi:Starter unit:ACP transacylase in aflatoxin biosynthesis